MSKYAVYGVGNALVDVVYDIDDNMLKSLEVDKGLMTLVEEDRQKQILEQLKSTQLVMRACGGSAANTMIAIAQLGGHPFYSCKVANDEMGDFYYEDLISNNVSTNLQLQDRSEGTTGSCIVLVTPDAQRSMNTYLGITGTFSTEQIVQERINQSQYLYIEGYLVASPTGKAAAIAAKDEAQKNGVKTSLTLSDINMVNFFRDELLEIIGDDLDLLFCNQEEALQFAKTTDLEEAKSFLKSLSKSFAITLGSKGAVLFDGEKEFFVKCPEVQAKDSNGAGDMFAGAFLYAITHNHNFEQAGKLACHCASELVTVDGPRMSPQKTIEVYKKTVQ